MSNRTRTRDGPATVFEPDPFVSKIAHLKDEVDIVSNPGGIEFGLVVVAGKFSLFFDDVMNYKSSSRI